MRPEKPDGKLSHLVRFVLNVERHVWVVTDFSGPPSGHERKQSEHERHWQKWMHKSKNHYPSIHVPQKQEDRKLHKFKIHISHSTSQAHECLTSRKRKSYTHRCHHDLTTEKVENMQKFSGFFCFCFFCCCCCGCCFPHDVDFCFPTYTNQNKEREGKQDQKYEVLKANAGNLSKSA